MADTVRRMDRAEITKRVERAEKLLQKGKTAEALEDYLQVLAAEPGNDTVCQMAADLCLSLQRIPQAVKLLGDLYERQIQVGDATRASLTYKKLARFVTPTWEQKLRFGELLEKSHPKQALETYEGVFEELAKQGRKQDSLVALNRVLALDSSEKNLQQLGELSSELGESKAAAAAFLKVAQLTQAAGGNAAQWVERAYAEDPTDPQIALGYSKNLLEQGQSGAAIFVLESQVNAGSTSEELRDTYAKALLAANRLSDAEPIQWQLFEANPARVQEIANLIGLFIDAQQDAEAVALGRKLEQYHRRKGDRRAFLTMIQDIAARHRASPELLEFMGEQFNASNRESDYCQTLLKLFDLYCSVGDYAKAADSLDRAAEVDAYESGHQKRLEMLRGKIDDNRFKVIASRFSSMADTAAAPLANQEKMLGAAALQDLMLQAEILVQYGMRSKAVERLQRIQELFPREEERNQDLRQLYMTAGLNPQYAGSGPVQPPASSVPAEQRGPQAGPAQSSEAADVSSFARVAEITRKLYRQSNADSVMLTAAKEIGAQWRVSRCVVAMRKPGLHTTSVKEYCSETIKPGEPRALEKIATTVHDLAINRGGTLTIADTQSSSDLQAVREALSQMGVTSLLALPLSDGAEHVGILLLMDSKPHAWGSNDVMVLKTISDQIVIALNNAGLRRLVKNLSVTDERSGLLKRASYLDLLMAETRRNAQQSTPLTVLLMQCGEKASMVKEFGESAVEAVMQQIGQLFAANIRQNDLAFRYETTTIAIVLGETPEKEGIMAAEKLQRLLAQLRMPEKQESIHFNAGLAEAVVRGEFDPVDIVTEVINRAEQALQTAVAQGTGKIVAMAASYAAAAVA
ncbi:MAG TPA: diguanylate cyclase [Terriglobales bacterium]|nr:diguanylate cyclase [Terriglobales bacterium]